MKDLATRIADAVYLEDDEHFNSFEALLGVIRAEIAKYETAGWACHECRASYRPEEVTNGAPIYSMTGQHLGGPLVSGLCDGKLQRLISAGEDS